jgi:hypothetical protein
MWHMLFPAHEEPHSIYAKGSVLEEAADHIRRCTMAAYQAIIPSVTATTNNRQDGASMPGTLQGIFGACLNAYTDMPPRFRQPHNHGACVNPPDSTEAQILGPFTQHTANGFAFPSEMSMSKTTGMYCGYQSQGEVDNLGQHNPYHDESSHYTAAVPEDLAFIASLSPITFPAGYFNGDEQDNSFALNGDFGIDTVLIRENRHCVTMDTGPPSPQVANSMDALPVCLDFTAEPFGPSPTGFGLGFGGCSGATSPTTNHSAPS